VSLIPERYYKAQAEELGGSRYQHNKKEKAPKQAIKEATKKAKRRKVCTILMAVGSRNF
jgi:hypothetical protein